MRAAGNSKWKSFIIGSLSGAVEPVGALAVVLLASLMTPALPYLLAFAAGAMFYVVVEELIPEASEGKHSNLSTIGFAIGFVLIMVLDVVMTQGGLAARALLQARRRLFRSVLQRTAPAVGTRRAVVPRCRHTRGCRRDPASKG